MKWRRKFVPIETPDPADLSKIDVKFALDDKGTTYSIATYVSPMIPAEDAERIADGIARGLREVGYEPMLTRTREWVETV